MRVSYDPRTDTLTVIFRQDEPVSEEKADTILDNDREGSLVSLEMLDASKRFVQARKIEFDT